MINKNLAKKAKFGFGLFVILLSIAISLFAFVTKDKNLVGLASHIFSSKEDDLTGLIEFESIKALNLEQGNYYINAEGIVYSLDKQKPVAKINFIEESQKNRLIYIDNQGRVGYLLKPMS